MPVSLRRAPVAACSAFACLLIGALPCHGDVLADANAFLATGRAEEAVALLEPLEPERAGEPAFDALLGAALLQAGDAPRASIALERATSVAPQLAGARLDLAIALYRMGSPEEARQAFTALRALDPPPEAARTIDDYLLRIERDQARRQWSFDLALSSGYDSNANSATSLNEFLGFTLTETSRATESSFYEVIANGGMDQPIGSDLTLNAELSVRHRTNPQADFVDATGSELTLGLRQDTARSARSVGLVGYRLEADGELNSDGAGIGARYQRRLRPRTSVGAFAHALAIRYGDELIVKDVDQWLAGFDLAHVWGPLQQATVHAGLQIGRDLTRDDSSPYGRRLYGLDAAMGWRFSPRLNGELGASRLRSDYEDPFFPSVLADDRRDTLTQASANLHWQIARKWTLTSELSYSRNETNVEVFGYDGGAIRITARRLWY
jgi:tetratricopeptide (TPR) repeat protein